VSLETGAAGIAYAPNALAATIEPAAAAIRGNFFIFVLPVMARPFNRASG
jgi:hypothetical protein